MTATSASARAPSRARTPTTTQAVRARPASGTLLATADAFLKTPDPMTVPTTMAVAVTYPRTRGSCWPGGCMAATVPAVGRARHGFPKKPPAPGNRRPAGPSAPASRMLEQGGGTIGRAVPGAGNGDLRPRLLPGGQPVAQPVRP